MGDPGRLFVVEDKAGVLTPMPDVGELPDPHASGMLIIPVLACSLTSRVGAEPTILDSLVLFNFCLFVKELTRCSRPCERVSLFLLSLILTTAEARLLPLLPRSVSLVSEKLFCLPILLIPLVLPILVALMELFDRYIDCFSVDDF